MTKQLLPILLGRYINTMARIAPGVAGAHGFRLFCYPFRPPLRSHQKSFLSAAALLRLEVASNEIQLYRWGNGPKKVLFLHGWQSHTYRWKPFIEMFSHDEYTLYSLDAPGHGMSAGSMLHVPMYSSVIEAVFEKFGHFDAVVSHSLGAFTLLYTIHHQNDLPVDKMVLLAPPGDATEFISFYRDTLRLNDQSIRRIENHFEREIKHPVTFFSAKTFARNQRRPGLIIHDRNDEDTAYTNSVAIHDAWPQSQLVITNGLGHNLKSPDIARQVVEYVRGTVNMRVKAGVEAG